MNMKNILFLSVTALILYSSNAFAGRWVDYHQYCNDLLKSQGIDCSIRPRVTGNSVFSKWAGEIYSVYGEQINGKPQVLKFKVQVTWTADSAAYQCNSYMVVNRIDVKDFTHRSLAMKECN